MTSFAAAAPENAVRSFDEEDERISAGENRSASNSNQMDIGEVNSPKRRKTRDEMDDGMKSMSRDSFHRCPSSIDDEANAKPRARKSHIPEGRAECKVDPNLLFVKSNPLQRRASTRQPLTTYDKSQNRSPKNAYFSAPKSAYFTAEEKAERNKNDSNSNTRSQSQNSNVVKSTSVTTKTIKPIRSIELSPENDSKAPLQSFMLDKDNSRKEQGAKSIPSIDDEPELTYGMIYDSAFSEERNEHADLDQKKQYDQKYSSPIPEDLGDEDDDDDDEVDDDSREKDPVARSLCSSLLQASKPTPNNGLVKCVVKRVRGSFKKFVCPSFQLYDEDGNLLMVAKKMKLHRHANYHIFDMTRAMVDTKTKKKNGNHIGKLRVKDNNRGLFTLFDNHERQTEIAAISFDQVSFIETLRDGPPPRIMRVIIPELDRNSVPVGNQVKKGGLSSMMGLTRNSLLDMLLKFNSQNSKMTPRNVTVLKNKMPSIKNGRYYLNFHGRVKIGSLKNFQLVKHDDEGEQLLCQFGKVTEEAFNLDFAYPLTPMQAFAMALCQFRL